MDPPKPLKTSGMNGHAPRVAIFVDMLSEYGRDIIMGVAGYIRTNRPWEVFGDPERVVAPIAQLETWRGDGVIAHVHTPALEKLIRAARVPVVNVSAVSAQRFASVLPDNAAVGKLAAEHFLERGFRAFGYCGFRNHAYSRIRGEAFGAAVQAAGHPCQCFESPPPQDRPSLWERRLGELVRWVEALPKPVAVLCCNDVRARHIAQACQFAQVRVPEELALLGVDNDELICEMSTPPLSSVGIAAEQVGYEAAAMLDRLMQGASPPDEPVLVAPSGVVTRRSSDVLAIDDTTVAAAVRYIHDHADQPIQVGDVVQAMSVSRRVLERRFKRALNRTINNEIALARLDRARQLLVYSDLPVAEVAERCGFNYAQQFHGLFRRHYGHTPSTYRRQFRKH